MFRRTSTAAAANAPLRVAILGPPGGGKGTQCTEIIKDFGLVHLSSGDLLREEIKEGTEFGQSVKEAMSRGELLGDDLMVKFMASHVDKTLQKGKGFVIDGVPRSVPQAKGMDEILSGMGKPFQVVLQLDVPEEVIMERLTGRRVHPASGRTYHIQYYPPQVEGKDDETGEDLIQRPDDTPEVIQRRIEEYKKQTLPLVEYYGEKGVLEVIPSPSSKEGYPYIVQALQQLL